jgi:DNA-binding winged helix-turn-helix (wHTH) protein/transposase-like protein
MAYSFEKRLRAVRMYLHEGTLQNVALHAGVHPITLCRWVQWYRTLPEQKTPCTYRKPWNRMPREQEQTIMLLKEHEPGLTLRKARMLLQHKGFFISLKGIRTVWQRYNLIRTSFEELFSPLGRETHETCHALKHVQLLLERDQQAITLRRAARIINDLPSFPVNYEPVLRRIPESYLSLRRRLDRLEVDFLSIPKPVLYRKARNLRRTFEKKDLQYSSILAGILEMLALHWMRTPQKEIELYKILCARKGTARDPVLNLALSFLAGTAYSELLDARNVRVCVLRCKRLLRSTQHAHIDLVIGDLWTFVSNYSQALRHYYRALSIIQDDNTRKEIKAKTALAAVIAGEYREVQQRFLHNLRIRPHDQHYVTYELIQALHHLGQGQLSTATEHLHNCLGQSEQEQLRNYIYTTAMSFAAIDHALGKHREARAILRKYLPLMKKYNVQREYFSLQILLGARDVPQQLDDFPIFRLMRYVVRAHQTSRLMYYTRALQYAKNNGLTGFLHRFLLFYPRPVHLLLDKGKKPDLPKSLLRLPVFNRSLPVFHVKLLGRTILYRNHIYHKIDLTPQENALLIAFAMRFNAQSKVISMAELLKNFWPDSRNPAYRLTRVLGRLRRILKLARHHIVTVSQHASKRLVNRGFYITTDYDDCVRIFSEARAFAQINEWSLAWEKYVEAFKLVRGAPCERMYDPWSEHTRRTILNKVEAELAHFTAMSKKFPAHQSVQSITHRISRIIASG